MVRGKHRQHQSSSWQGHLLFAAKLAVRGGPASTTQERKLRACAAGHCERSLPMFSVRGTAFSVRSVSVSFAPRAACELCFHSFAQPTIAVSLASVAAACPYVCVFT